MHSFHLGLLLNIKFSLCKQIPLTHWKDNKERVVSTSLVIMKYESTTKAEISLPTSRMSDSGLSSSKLIIHLLIGPVLPDTTASDMMMPVA